MSKRIVVSLWFCTLLGACALNTGSVEAQVSAHQAPTTSELDPRNLTEAAVTPAVVPLSTHPDSATEDEEPESTTTAPETPAAEPVAAPAVPSLPACPDANGQLQNQIAGQICQRIRTEPLPTVLKVDNRDLRMMEYLIPFYVQRDYRAGWLDAEGKPLPAANELVKALGEADREGLQPSDYDRAQLRKLLDGLQKGNGSPDARQLANVDLLLTDTYLKYASHVLSGRLAPRKVDPDWAIKPRSRNLATVLQDALSSGQIGESLQALAPKNKGYVQLRETLQRYRKIEQQGGWPTVTSANLASGAQGPQVRALRTRLLASGDLSGGEAEKNGGYDKAVADAVRRFQKRHGLPETGAVNAATQAALNVPVSERIRRVELNMERWRWLPDDFGSRYILVNIPSFKMSVFENGKLVIESKVVVGREERQTPTFTANMAYLVLSPKWYVPRSIAVKDKLPQLKRNPNALAKQNIRIYDSAGRQVNPGSVNWKAVSANNFSYQLRQDAGPRNALGGIKFMFPNPYNVYLHDTPSRELFSRNQRTYSSGCIRISNPVELAEYLLKHDSRWNRDTILAASTSGKQRVVNLPQQMPVYLLYWTAWVDENGQVQFRDDIYNRDKPLVRALYQDDAGIKSGKGA